MTSLAQQFGAQSFANGYALVDGVQMNVENPEHFKIPPPVLKKYVTVGHFVELRIDSPRFSVHEDAVEKCYCPTCNGEASKPILGHEHPASLLPLPIHDVPSRGWGEDFWVQVVDRDGMYFRAMVDNPLVEARLHELQRGDTIYFHEDYILAIHGSHRQEIVMGMEPSDLKKLAKWLELNRP